MNKQDHYIYPAVFEYANEDHIGVFFPDLPGCVSQSSNDIEAYRNAKEALALHLYGIKEDSDQLPAPSKLSELTFSKQKGYSYGTVMIDVWMTPFIDHMNNKSIKKKSPSLSG